MEWYYDALDEGLEPVVPYIFRIPKGKTSSSSLPVVSNGDCPAEVPVPDSLILVHHQIGWFSLQPVKGLPLGGALGTLRSESALNAKRLSRIQQHVGCILLRTCRENLSGEMARGLRLQLRRCRR